MPINQSFLGELDHEVSTTRKMILRIPDDKLDWKPHEKSMTAGKLASHIAEMYSWGDATIRVDELDLAPVGGTKWEAFRWQVGCRNRRQAGREFRFGKRGAHRRH